MCSSVVIRMIVILHEVATSSRLKRAAHLGPQIRTPPFHHFSASPSNIAVTLPPRHLPQSNSYHNVSGYSSYFNPAGRLPSPALPQMAGRARAHQGPSSPRAAPPSTRYSPLLPVTPAGIRSLLTLNNGSRICSSTQSSSLITRTRKPRSPPFPAKSGGE